MKKFARWMAALLFISALLTAGAALAEQTLTLPADLEIIEEEAFYGDASIRKVILPDGLREIHDYAFANTFLTQIDIPSSVTYIAEMAFHGCGSPLVRVEKGSYAHTWALEHGLCVQEGDLIYRLAGYDNDGNVGAWLTGYTGESTEVTIPATLGGCPVVAIDASAFSGMETLTSVSLPEGLLRIEQFAFHYCIRLSTVNLPQTLTYIGMNAFYNCNLTTLKLPPQITTIHEFSFAANEFTTLQIPENVTLIQQNAFYDAAQLTTITIPASVVTIEEGAFGYNPNLADCYYGGTRDDWSKIEIGANNYYLERAHIVFTDGEQPSTRFQWTLEDGVLTLTGQGESEDYFWIGDDGISAPWSDRRREITEIVVGEGITELHGPAFAYCTNATKVTLPSTLTTIGNTVFDGCFALETVTIPDGVTAIGSCAFYDCLELKTVRIPASITSFDLYAFWNCPLTDIYYGGSQAQWQMIAGLESASIPSTAVLHFDIENSFEGDFGYLIEDGEGIITAYVGTDTAITIPAEIEGYPVREVNISRLNADSTENTAVQRVTEVHLPSSVQRLGEGAFRDWTNLTTITGLSSVQTIGEYCFSGSGVTALEFSAALSYAGLYAFDANELRTLTIPDTLQWKGLGGQSMTESETIFWNHEQLAYINLITTGNTPTLAMHGPALYTADMRTLVCYPCRNPLNSYTIPEGVVNSYARAFDVRDIYDTSGLYEVHVPTSMTGLGPGIFYQGLNVTSPDGTVQNVLLPRLVVIEGTDAHNMCLITGDYKLYWRLADEISLEEKIAQVIAETVTEEMTDREKALALNDYLVASVDYDFTLTRFGAGDALLDGIAMCQGYTLAYAELLSACGIENGVVRADNISHCFNSLLLDGQWVYTDVTWNDSEEGNLYFAMSAETAKEVYGFTPDASGQ